MALTLSLPLSLQDKLAALRAKTKVLLSVAGETKAGPATEDTAF